MIVVKVTDLGDERDNPTTHFLLTALLHKLREQAALYFHTSLIYPIHVYTVYQGYEGLQGLIGSSPHSN